MLLDPLAFLLLTPRWVSAVPIRMKHKVNFSPLNIFLNATMSPATISLREQSPYPRGWHTFKTGFFQVLTFVSYEKAHLVGEKAKGGFVHSIEMMVSSSIPGSELLAGCEVTTFRSDFVQSIQVGAPHLVTRLEIIPHPNLCSFSFKRRTMWSSISFLLISRFPKEQKQGPNDE